MSGMHPESPTAKSFKRQDEEPGRQYHATSLVIQELLRSVEGFHASLKMISARVDGIGKWTLNNKLLQSYISVILTNYRFASGEQQTLG